MTGSGPRYYELRLYRMHPTRMPDFHDLLGSKVPPLFEKCGIPKPLGFWESYAGPFAPLFGYILPWGSLDDRMTAWTRFYGDPDWQRELAANYAGAQRVDRPSVFILRPSPHWNDYRDEGNVEKVPGVHELRFYRNRRDDSSVRFSDRIAAAAQHGAQVLGLFDVEIGLATDTRVAILAWPDDNSRRATLSAEAQEHSACDCDIQILAPIEYGVPRTGLVSI